MMNGNEPPLSVQSRAMRLALWQNTEAERHDGMRSMSESREKTGTVKRPRPLVGFTGVYNSISVTRRPDGIDCRVSCRSYAFLLAGTALFGPVLEIMLYFRPIVAHTPGFIVGAVWLLSLVSAVIFIRYSLGCPRFTANYGTGEILYYAWWGSRPSFVLRREEIQSIQVEERPFLDEGARIPNFCLTVTTSQDKQYALCVSTGQQLIGTLRSDLANARFGRI